MIGFDEWKRYMCPFDANVLICQRCACYLGLTKYYLYSCSLYHPATWRMLLQMEAEQIMKEIINARLDR